MSEQSLKDKTKMELQESIIHALEGNAVLFLGSGFSIEERGDGLTFPYGRRAKPSLFESVALQSCFTNNRSQQ